MPIWLQNDPKNKRDQTDSFQTYKLSYKYFNENKVQKKNDKNNEFHSNVTQIMDWLWNNLKMKIN